MWRRKKTRSSFLSFGWILSFWTVTVHFSHFYMQNIIPGLPEMETSGHVPPNWTCRDVLSTQRQTHRRSQNIASSPPTNGISFSAAEGTKVRKTLAAFQQDPPPHHHHLQPPLLCSSAGRTFTINRKHLSRQRKCYSLIGLM